MVCSNCKHRYKWHASGSENNILTDRKGEKEKGKQKAIEITSGIKGR